MVHKQPIKVSLAQEFCIKVILRMWIFIYLLYILVKNGKFKTFRMYYQLYYNNITILRNLFTTTLYYNLAID